MSEAEPDGVERKRVVFCTYSSVYSSIVLEQLIAANLQSSKNSKKNNTTVKIDVVGIINSTRIIHPKFGFVTGAVQQIKRSGFRYASYLFMVTDLFRWLQPLSKKIIPHLHKSVHGLAKKYDIPLLDTLDINHSDSLDFIKTCKPDYILCAHFNQLVKPVLLENPNIDAINIHPSLLPAYKGVDPVFYALLAQEEQGGVTLHEMSEDFDAGKILLQKSLPINTKQSLYAFNCQLFSDGVTLALEWMQRESSSNIIAEDADYISGISNDINNKVVNHDTGSEDNEHYDSWPTRAHIKQFKQAGNHLIHLSELWKRPQ